MYCSYHSNQRFSLLFHQGVDDENKRVVSSEKVLNVAFGREVADELPRVSTAALKEGLSHDTGSRIQAVAMDPFPRKGPRVCWSQSCWRTIRESRQASVGRDEFTVHVPKISHGRDVPGVFLGEAGGQA